MVLDVEVTIDTTEVIENTTNLSQFVVDSSRGEIVGWLRATKRSFSVDEVLVSGMTGATVLRALMHTSDSADRKVVVKIIPADEDLQEPSRHGSASSMLSAEFTARHMVDLVDSLTLSDGTSIMIQALAGGSVFDFASLGALSHTSDFRRASKSMLSVLATETWTRLSATPSTIAAVAAQQLRSKLAPGGSLRTWLEDEFGPDVMVAGSLTFSDDSSATPWFNPIVLSDAARTGGASGITVLAGPSHGDLHAENVLCRLGRAPDFENFRLIDFSYFEKSASLAIDPVTLVLAEVQRRVADLKFSDRRQLVQSFGDHGPDATVSPEVEDILEIERDARLIGLTRAQEKGFADEWPVLWDVAVCSAALVWASRPRIGFNDRVWFLELAARAASRIATSRALAAEPNSASIGEPFDTRRESALSLVDELMAQNERFEGSVTSVAILPASAGLSLAAQTSIASAGWDVVLGFDSRAADDGAPAVAIDQGAAVRILRPSQDLAFSRASTIWVAADGLEGTGHEQGKTLIEWRREDLAGISDMLQVVTRASTGPVVVTVFGILDRKSHLLLEKLLDHAGPRARLISVHSTEPSGIEDYDPLELVGDIELVAKSIPARLATNRSSANRVFVPSGPDGATPVELEFEDQLWFRQSGGELVHSGVAMESHAVEGVAADFYRGRRISWLELESGVDIGRGEVFDKLHSEVDALLSERGTRRVRFRHAAGAGGTTVARRLAWSMHDRYPTLIYSQLLTVEDVTSRFERLSYLTGSRVLIILDGVPERLTSLLFERLQADSASAVLVLVERHVGLSDGADLGSMPPQESDLFKRIFWSLSPGRNNDLQRLSAGPAAAQIPFLYALTAFQDGFHGVEDYVARSLRETDAATKTVLATLAVVQRYAGESVPASVFANVLNLPRNATVRLAASMQKRASGLVLEDSVGQWRTPHTVIAREIIRQLFVVGSADGVTMSLSAWAQDFIETVGDAYPDPLPEPVHQLLLKLFVLRENRDESAYGSRQRFSELISDLPQSARFEVMRTLAETFSSDPHLWAHYARLLAYEGGDFEGAYEKVDKALSLSSEDPTIWHIRGVIGRKKVADLTSSERVGIEDAYELETKVRAATKETIEDLARAAELSDDSRYPQIDTIFLAISVIEWARTFKGAASHQALLTSETGAFYATLLDSAEAALDDLDGLQQEDPGHQIAEDARIKLHAIYDDYQALIDGWKRKLNQPGVQNSLVRSRLARAYVQRAGSLRALDFASNAEVTSLMEANLRDDSRDFRSIRRWLRTARRSGGDLDRASEYVADWVEESPSRDARYYDYVIAALLTLHGRTSSRVDFERKLDLSKSRSQSYSRRRVIYEWLGNGVQLAALVHHSQVADWDRRAERTSDPTGLRRVSGVIDSVANARSGYLLIEGGLRVFFTPGGRFMRGRNEGDKVTALIGFAYDGPEAWWVSPA